MSGSFNLPKDTLFGAAGALLSGGKLYFYLTGTSTPADTYTTSALSVANANPVVADADGRIGPIYLDPDITYKVVLKTSAEVTVWTVDPVNALSLAGSDISTRLLQVASCPLDYGAAGDGSTNDAVALQAAISGATGTIDLVGKTYRCDTALTIGSGKRLVNGTIDFSAAASTALITCAGSIGSSITLGANATVGAKTLTLSSTAGLAAGDYLLLSSSAAYASGIADGEIVRVQSVDSATVITLTARIFWSYATADAANVQKITQVKNTSFENLRIQCATASTQRAIVVQYGQNIHLRDVVVDGVYTAAVQVDTSINFSLEGVIATDLGDTAAGTGIELVGACDAWKIDRSHVDKCAYGIKTGNGTRGVVRCGAITDSRVAGAIETGILMGIDTYNVRVERCDIAGHSTANTEGIYCYGGNCEIVGNHIRSTQGSAIVLEPSRTVSYSSDDIGAGCHNNRIFSSTQKGIHVRLAPSVNLRSIAISGNTIGPTGASQAGIAFSIVSGNPAVEQVYIANNRIYSTNFEGMDLDFGASSVSQVTVHGNQVDTPGRDGISLECTGSIDRVLIDQNTVVNPGASGYGIYCDVVSGFVSASRNSIDGDGLGAIRVLNATNVNVSDNHSLDSGITAIYVSTANTLTCRGNTVLNSSAGGIGVQDVNQSTVITGNVVRAAGTGGIVFTQTSVDSTGVVISSNVVDTAGDDGITVRANGGSVSIIGVNISNNTVVAPTGDGIQLVSTNSTVGISDISIVGNTIRNSSDHGIHLNAGTSTTIDQFVISGNYIRVGNDTDACIMMEGATIEDGWVSGNNCVDGAYGARTTASTTTRVSLGANYLISNLTAAVNGTFRYDATSTAEADLPSFTD